MESPVIGPPLLRGTPDGRSTRRARQYDELAPPSSGASDALPSRPHRFVRHAKTLAEHRAGDARIRPGDGRVLVVGEGYAFRAHGGIVTIRSPKRGNFPPVRRLAPRQTGR